MRVGLGVALVGLVVCVGCGREPDAATPRAQPVDRVADSLPPVAKPELPQAPPKVEVAAKKLLTPKLTPEEAITSIKKLGGVVQVDKDKAVVRVYLHRTKVSDAGLAHLKGLTKLESLLLYSTKVTNAGVKQLQQALPNCKIKH